MGTAALDQAARSRHTRYAQARRSRRMPFNACWNRRARPGFLGDTPSEHLGKVVRGSPTASVAFSGRRGPSRSEVRPEGWPSRCDGRGGNGLPRVQIVFIRVAWSWLSAICFSPAPWPPYTNRTAARGCDCDRGDRLLQPGTTERNNGKRPVIVRGGKLTRLVVGDAFVAEFHEVYTSLFKVQQVLDGKVNATPRRINEPCVRDIQRRQFVL